MLLLQMLLSSCDAGQHAHVRVHADAAAADGVAGGEMHCGQEELHLTRVHEHGLAGAAQHLGARVTIIHL